MLRIFKHTILYRLLVIIKDWLKILLYKRGNDIEINRNYVVLNLPGYQNTFFGYYDYSPFNPNDPGLITFHSNNLDINKKPDGFVDIILYGLNKNEYQVIGKTQSWNWQQGSRLSWLDANNLIYNIYNSNNDTYESTVYNIKTGSSKGCPMPFQAALNASEILSIDYKILAETRPDYGYFAHRIKSIDYSEGSIILYNLQLNSTSQVLGVEDIKPHLNFSLDKLKYWFNHLLVSPNGQRMIFLFRVLKEGKVHHHLFLYSFKTKVLKLLLKNVVSHYCWKNDDEILYWGKQPNSGYFIYNISNGSNITLLEVFPDGHPSMRKGVLFSDTYPMRDRRRKLFTYDLKNNVEEVIGYFFEDPKYRYENRCDLHPSLSNDGSLIQVDSNFNGHRSVIVIENA